MKRDMDLVRTMVKELASEERSGPLRSVESVDDEVFCYHAMLLIEGGLADGAMQRKLQGVPAGAMLYCLTWAGQDFADLVDSDTVWNRVRERVIEPARSWSFDVLLTILKGEAVRHFPGL